MLATYSYTEEEVNDRKYDLDRLDYGNGDSVQYEYDDQGRKIKEIFEDGDTVTYLYDSDGALATVIDSESGITANYTYDLIGRLTKYTETGTGHSVIINYTYDEEGKLTVPLALKADAKSKGFKGTKQLTKYLEKKKIGTYYVNLLIDMGTNVIVNTVTSVAGLED